MVFKEMSDYEKTVSVVAGQMFAMMLNLQFQEKALITGEYESDLRAQCIADASDLVDNVIAFARDARP